MGRATQTLQVTASPSLFRFKGIAASWVPGLLQSVGVQDKTEVFEFMAQGALDMKP